MEYPDLDLKDNMPFGKYKGKTIEYIIDTDVSYMSWIIENVKTFKLTKEALKKFYLEYNK